MSTLTTFNGDVVVTEDLTVQDNLVIQGSTVINGALTTTGPVTFDVAPVFPAGPVTFNQIETNTIEAETDADPVAVFNDATGTVTIATSAADVQLGGATSNVRIPGTLTGEQISPGIFEPLTLPSGVAVDTVSAIGESATLFNNADTFVGIAQTADQIIIGGPLSNLSIPGTTTFNQTVINTITNPVIILNNGGAPGSAVGSGIFIEEGGDSDSGFIITNGTRTGYRVLAPTNPPPGIGPNSEILLSTNALVPTTFVSNVQAPSFSGVGATAASFPNGADITGSLTLDDATISGTLTAPLIQAQVIESANDVAPVLLFNDVGATGPITFSAPGRTTNFLGTIDFSNATTVDFGTTTLDFSESTIDAVAFNAAGPATSTFDGPVVFNSSVSFSQGITFDTNNIQAANDAAPVTLFTDATSTIDFGTSASVINTGPLNASGLTVNGPSNFSSSTLNFGAQPISTTGAISGQTLSSASSITAGGLISGGSLSVTGSITGNTVNATTVSATGAISGNSVSATTTLSGQDLSVVNITATGTAGISGAVTAGSYSGFSGNPASFPNGIATSSAIPAGASMNTPVNLYTTMQTGVLSIGHDNATADTEGASSVIVSTRDTGTVEIGTNSASIIIGSAAAPVSTTTVNGNVSFPGTTAVSFGMRDISTGGTITAAGFNGPVTGGITGPITTNTIQTQNAGDPISIFNELAASGPITFAAVPGDQITIGATTRNLVLNGNVVSLDSFAAEGNIDFSGGASTAVNFGTRNINNAGVVSASSISAVSGTFSGTLEAASYIGTGATPAVFPTGIDASGQTVTAAVFQGGTFNGSITGPVVTNSIEAQVDGNPVAIFNDATGTIGFANIAGSAITIGEATRTLTLNGLVSTPNSLTAGGTLDFTGTSAVPFGSRAITTSGAISGGAISGTTGTFSGQVQALSYTGTGGIAASFPAGFSSTAQSVVTAGTGPVLRSSLTALSDGSLATSQLAFGDSGLAQAGYLNGGASSIRLANASGIGQVRIYQNDNALQPPGYPEFVTNVTEVFQQAKLRAWYLKSLPDNSNADLDPVTAGTVYTDLVADGSGPHTLTLRSASPSPADQNTLIPGMWWEFHLNTTIGGGSSILNATGSGVQIRYQGVTINGVPPPDTVSILVNNGAAIDNLTRYLYMRIYYIGVSGGNLIYMIQGQAT